MKFDPCGVCGGLGWIDKGDPENGVIMECPVCQGTGEQQEEETKYA